MQDVADSVHYLEAPLTTNPHFRSFKVQNSFEPQFFFNTQIHILFITLCQMLPPQPRSTQAIPSTATTPSMFVLQLHNKIQHVSFKSYDFEWWVCSCVQLQNCRSKGCTWVTPFTRRRACSPWFLDLRNLNRKVYAMSFWFFFFYFVCWNCRFNVWL